MMKVLLVVVLSGMRLSRGFLAVERHMRRGMALSAKEEVDPGRIAGLEIVKYPHPALRAKNLEIEEPESVAPLAKRMLQLMYEANGVGLAAPQVGINLRLMVFNPEGKKERWLDEVVLVNPNIIAKSDGLDRDVEGCLSFPEMSGTVERHKWIKVEALSTKGKTIKKKYTGWTARIFQHEFDHLDSIVYIDHLSTSDRDAIQPKLDALIQDFSTTQEKDDLLQPAL